MTSFTLAVDGQRGKDGEQRADFIRIVVFGKQAENCNKYLSKGRQAAVVGRIHTDSYTNKNGDRVYTTDVVASRVEFLGGSKQETTAEPQNTETYYPEQIAFEAVDDDIPF